MPFNLTAPIWPNKSDNFFRDRHFAPLRQHGPRCVATSLAIIAGVSVDIFEGSINTQDPFSWSDALKPMGMKLCYCPTDIRRIEFYLPELIELDDLFILSYYTTNNMKVLFGDPDDRGWLCGSHVIVLHKDMVLDPATGRVTKAADHKCNRFHTKRIFRVVRNDYPRGI